MVGIFITVLDPQLRCFMIPANQILLSFNCFMVFLKNLSFKCLGSTQKRKKGQLKLLTNFILLYCTVYMYDDICSVCIPTWRLYAHYFLYGYPFQELSMVTSQMQVKLVTIHSGISWKCVISPHRSVDRMGAQVPSHLQRWYIRSKLRLCVHVSCVWLR